MFSFYSYPLQVLILLVPLSLSILALGVLIYSARKIRRERKSIQPALQTQELQGLHAQPGILGQGGRSPSPFGTQKLPLKGLLPAYTDDLQPEDYAAILEDIDLGVLAFDSTGRKVYSNQTAINMLGEDCWSILQLEDFLDTYGLDNGLKAGVILGKRRVSGIYRSEGKAILLDLQEFEREASHRFTTITTLDMTQQEALEDQRKQFVANVSHELKTPLTTILTYAECLTDWGIHERNPDEIYRDIKKIYEEGCRMQSLVSNLALLSALDSQGIRPLMDEVDLNLLVQYCVDRFQDTAEAKGIALHLLADPNTPLVFGERTSLERIINNLIENALKYTKPEGEVNLTLAYIRDEVYLKVQDTGIGIQTENLPRIFERFFRVDRSGSSVLGGTGLGLAIAKELVDLHEGRLSVTSKYEEGSEFVLFLPSVRKVMGRTLDAVRTGLGRKSLLLDAAGEVLLAQAQLFNPKLTSLSDLGEEEADRLLLSYRTGERSGGAEVSEGAGKEL